MPMNPFFDPFRFSSEFIYTLLIFVFCFVIYFKTKDMYELTKYKGIRYFRNAFFLFGLAYLVRFVLHLGMITSFTFGYRMAMRSLHMPLLVVTGYLSTLAIFYLLYSLVWKKIKAKYFWVFSNLIAILVSVVAFFTRSHFILIGIQFILLVFAVILSFVKHKKKKKSHIRILYVLIMIFWLFNLYVIGPRRLLPHEFRILSQIISVIVFFIIYLKVTKWAK